MKLDDLMRVIDPNIKVCLDCKMTGTEPTCVFKKDAYDLSDIWSFKKYYGSAEVINIKPSSNKLALDAIIVKIKREGETK